MEHSTPEITSSHLHGGGDGAGDVLALAEVEVVEPRHRTRLGGDFAGQEPVARGGGVAYLVRGVW